MTLPDDPHAASRERLSALMDGELDGPVLHQACDHWRVEAEARSTWHVYHLIGDVLRSDDLAGGAGRNAAFLLTLRERMVAEPVVLAPMPVAETPAFDSANGGRAGSRAAGPAGRRTGWRGPIALAAGVVAAVGLGSWIKVPSPFGGSSLGPSAVALVAAPGAEGLAGRGAVVPTSVETGGATSAAEPRALLPTDPLIRNARLDRYLQAHQQFAGSSALGVPSGFLRAATTEPIAR